MKTLRWLGKALGFVLTAAAKALGGMSGAQTFGQDNATSLYKQRNDYRP